MTTRMPTATRPDTARPGGIAPHSVAVVDDHPLVRAGLETLISETSDLVLAASVGALNELDPHHQPDVLLVGLPIAGEAERALVTALACTRTVLSSTWAQPPTMAAMIRAGARGYVTRRCGVTTIVTALSTVASGGMYVCPEVADQFQYELTRSVQEDTMELSPREIETLRWIADGLTHAQIARRMGLTEATVNTYTKRIRAKLNAGNKAELTRIAIELGHVGFRPHRSPAA